MNINELYDFKSSLLLFPKIRKMTALVCSRYKNEFAFCVHSHINPDQVYNS